MYKRSGFWFLVSTEESRSLHSAMLTRSINGNGLWVFNSFKRRRSVGTTVRRFKLVLLEILQETIFKHTSRCLKDMLEKIGKKVEIIPPEVTWIVNFRNPLQQYITKDGRY